MVILTLCLSFQRKDQELRARECHQEDLDMLYAKREADRIFLEKQHLKAQKAKEDGRVLQSHHIHQMVNVRVNGVIVMSCPVVL